MTDDQAARMARAREAAGLPELPLVRDFRPGDRVRGIAGKTHNLEGTVHDVAGVVGDGRVDAVLHVRWDERVVGRTQWLDHAPGEVVHLF
jgi:hypothetical protein